MNSRLQQEHNRALVLASGIASLILTLGIARFGYTPLLPVMQNQTWLNDLYGGWLATSNYTGYICGAIVASLVSDLKTKDLLYRIGLVLAVLTTLGMGLTEDMMVWAIMRFIAGLSSAAGVLIGSGLLLNWLIRHHHHSELGIHFSGIGLGIVLVSASVWFMNQYLAWDAQWAILGFIGLLLMIPAWLWLPPPDTSGMTKTGQAMTDTPPEKQFMILIFIAYLCAGFGYVVSATFIVDMIESINALRGTGELAFLVIGIAATPACIIWDLIARKTGVISALLYAYVLNIIGIILPALSDSFMLVLLGSVLFGGTFIGIVSLVLTMAGRFYPTKPAKLMGKLTIAYGIAQIIGPAIAGYIAETTGSYLGALYLACGFMVLGSIMLLKLKSTAYSAL
ncbi:MAG TPA: YbfB/YjiJ family MFS transporter [Gammaproteobacteria bacterium]